MTDTKLIHVDPFLTDSEYISILVDEHRQGWAAVERITPSVWRLQKSWLAGLLTRILYKRPRR